MLCVCVCILGVYVCVPAGGCEEGLCMYVCVFRECMCVCMCECWPVCGRECSVCMCVSSVCMYVCVLAARWEGGLCVYECVLCVCVCVVCMCVCSGRRVRGRVVRV